MNTITKLVLLGLVLFMTACAPKNGTSNSYDLSSSSTDTTTSTKSLAYCNQAVNSGYTMNIQAYVQNSTSQVNMNYAVVKLTAVPSTFSSGTSHIAFWKWLANSANQVSFDQSALSFYVLDTVTGDAITGWQNTLRWSDLAAKYTAWGSTSVASFLSRLHIVVNLRDPNGDYDAIELASYTTSTGAIAGQVDALLPMFAANPNEYAIDPTGAARATRLKNLHPFASLASQSWTSAQYQTMSNSFCF